MRATIDGWRLAPIVQSSTIHSGAKQAIKAANSPEVIWGGNPYCDPGTVLYLTGYPGTGASIYDFSGQGNDGVITGSTWTTNTRGLNYLSYDGINDVVKVTDVASISALAVVGIELWFLSDGMPGAEEGIISKAGIGIADREWNLLMDTSGRIGFVQWGGVTNYLIAIGTNDFSGSG